MCLFLTQACNPASTSSLLTRYQQETISVDETQFEYLLALLGTNLSSVESHNRQPSDASHSKAASATAHQNNSGSSGSGASSSQSKEAAHTVSLVASVKEILPDFGDGFVAACLHAMGNKVEAVVQALLEGSLPDSVSQLDSKLAVWPPAAAAAARGTAVDAKGGKARGGAAASGSRGHGRGAPDEDEVSFKKRL